MGQNSYTYDNALLLKDAGAITADGAGQVAAANRILDLGAASRFYGTLVAQVSAIDVSSADESYIISAQFSSSPTFASAVIGGSAIRLGAAAALQGESAASGTGRFEVPFSNEINGVLYRYMRVYIDVGGTTPSVNFTAYVVKSAR